MGVSIGTALGVTVLLGDSLPTAVLGSGAPARVMVVSTVAVNLGGGSDCCRRYFMGLGSFRKEDKFGSVEWLLSRIFGISKRSRTASLMVNLSMYCCKMPSASSWDRAFLYAS